MTRPKPEVGSDRLPPIPPEEYSAEQRSAAARLIATPRGEVRGPFIPLLRSPELLDRVQGLGEYLRYHSRVPKRLRELAILTTALHWRQPYEWYAHVRPAIEAGVDPELLEDLAEARPLGSAQQDERTVHQFVVEVHQRGSVSDSIYAGVESLLGEDGVVDLLAICGYYSLLAMVLNVARTPSPDTDFTIPR